MNFDDIVSQSESLVKHLDEENIPHVHKSIENLRQQRDKLAPRIADNDIKAAKLLGNKVGFELSNKLCKKLESLDTLSNGDRIGNINSEDIPSFLKNQREKATLTAFSIAKTNSYRESCIKIEKAKNDWWMKEKNNILNVIVNSDKLPQLLRIAGRTKLTNVGEKDRFSSAGLTKEEAEYGCQVSKFIDSLMLGGDDNIGCELPIEDVVLAPMKTSRHTELSELYRLVSRLCRSGETLSGGESLLEARGIEGSLSRHLLEASTEHLEQEFLSFMQQCIAVNRSGQLTGPGSVDARRTVGMFVQSLLLKEDLGQYEDGCVDGSPVWPLLYVCLRSGQLGLALDICRDASGDVGPVGGVLAQIQRDGTFGVHNCESAKRLAADYKRAVRGSTDTCKRLVYCLVSGADVEDNHTRVLTSVDDFLWARLWHCRRSPTELLEPLQSLIGDEQGETYFQAADNPLGFVRLLLLSLQLETACSFLARFEHFLSHAVHLGVVLWSRNLLLVNGDLRAPLVSRGGELEPTGTWRLNLSRLVAMYTVRFETSSPQTALELMVLLRSLLVWCTGGGGCEDDEETGQQARSALVVLASRMAVDGGQLAAVLEARLGPGHAATAAEVLEAAAARLGRLGELSAASDALVLAGKLSEAASLLQQSLSLALGSTELADKARTLLSRAGSYMQQNQHCSSLTQLQNTLAVANFVQTATRPGCEEAALAALDETGMVPPCLRRENGIQHQRSLLPTVLALTMEVLRRLAARLRSEQHNHHHREALQQELQTRGAAIVVFVGQLQFRLPAELYASLSQLGMDLLE